MRTVFFFFVLFLFTQAARAQSSQDTATIYPTCKAATVGAERSAARYTTASRQTFAVYVTEVGYTVFYIVQTSAGFRREVLAEEATAGTN